MLFRSVVASVGVAEPGEHRRGVRHAGASRADERQLVAPARLARRWSSETTGIILSAGGGAMGVRLGTPAEYAPGVPEVDVTAYESAGGEVDVLPGEEPSNRALQSTVGLIWRALLLWILLLLLVSIANWLG